MGTVTSQLGQSNLKVVGSPVLTNKAELEKQKKQPQILVSINKDNTVRISEGKSTATQTPRDRYDLYETEEKAKVQIEETHKVKELMKTENRHDRSVQTDTTVDGSKTEEMKSCADNNQVVIPPLRFEREERESVSTNERIQNANQNTSSNTDARGSENEVGETACWSDITEQTVDQADHESHTEESKSHANENQEAEKGQENFASKAYLQKTEQIVEDENEAGETDYSTDIGIQTDDDFDHEQLGPRLAWGSKSVDSTKSLYLNSKEASNKEEKETDTRTECRTPTAVRPFEQLSLDKYGKYKVRLSNDEEKCIISSATFLDTGDAVVIDRSNLKIKFVDKGFEFISFYDLSAKPWAVCARGIDVYVTMGNTKIQHLTVEDMILEPVEVFEIKGRCLGICVFGEHLAVGLQVGEVCLLDFKGNKQGIIQLPTFNGKPCNPWHLTVTAEDNILVTDSDAGALYCLNNKSELVFTFKGLGSPRGTAVDSEGNILVVGRDKETGAVVTIIHKDGELHHMLHIEQQSEMTNRVLMTWEQLEFVPYCICCRKDRVVILGGIQESLKIMKM